MISIINKRISLLCYILIMGLERKSADKSRFFLLHETRRRCICEAIDLANRVIIRNNDWSRKCGESSLWLGTRGFLISDASTDRFVHHVAHNASFRIRFPSCSLSKRDQITLPFYSLRNYFSSSQLYILCTSLYKTIHFLEMIFFLNSNIWYIYIKILKNPHILSFK